MRGASFQEVQVASSTVIDEHCRVSLRGLFIWAVTQDTAQNDLLNAVLQPDGLGKFRKRNGVQSGADYWDTTTPDHCVFSGKSILELLS